MTEPIHITKGLLKAATSVAHRLDYAIFGSLSERYLKALEREVNNCASVLDLGCGSSSPIASFARRLPYTVGVDGHETALAKSRASRIHDEYICMNILETENAFPDRSFDCVIALDLIEHLTKGDGLRLLRTMERIALRKVVVFTPNGFLPQGAIDGNELQQHRSGWGVTEMRARGYRVLGVNGWKPLRGVRASPAWRPYFFWGRVSLLTVPFFEQHPEYAFQMLCIKDIV